MVSELCSWIGGGGGWITTFAEGEAVLTLLLGLFGVCNFPLLFFSKWISCQIWAERSGLSLKLCKWHWRIRQVSERSFCSASGSVLWFHIFFGNIALPKNENTKWLASMFWSEQRIILQDKGKKHVWRCCQNLLLYLISPPIFSLYPIKWAEHWAPVPTKQ